MSSDTTTSQREARRRKILENAAHRLAKIAGNEEFISKSENNINFGENGTINKIEEKSNVYIRNGGAHGHTPSVELNEANPSLNHILHNELNYSVDENIDRLLRDLKKNDSIAEEHKEKNFVPPSQDLSRSSQHIFVVCLAVVVRVLLAFNLGYLINDNIVVPFFLMTIFRLFWTRKQPAPVIGLFKTALILSGISPEKVSYLLEIYTIINQVLQEFILYLFVFLAVHVLISLLRTS